ncbi:MAG: dihydrodipicolinate synthase family protein, partial [Burkholderiales bacterium]|nr:dihydrodipicolinate synthase family protein [Burkholderiales bacterium]
APKLMHEMCKLGMERKEKESRAINDRLMGLHKNLFIEANPIPVKWALNQMGLIKEGIRLPLTPLSTKHHDSVRQAMRSAGVID